jgi:hypothetical protein
MEEHGINPDHRHFTICQRRKHRYLLKKYSRDLFRTASGPLPDPEAFQKLSKTFLRIYEFFENSGNIFRITTEVSGSGVFRIRSFQDP